MLSSWPHTELRQDIAKGDIGDTHWMVYRLFGSLRGDVWRDGREDRVHIWHFHSKEDLIEKTIRQAKIMAGVKDDGV